MYKDIQLKITKDGSHTLYLPELDEHYHSIHGAVNESVHVFLKEGFSYYPSTDVRILEIGFGTGLNAILTMIRAEEEDRTVTYHSVDIHPLPLEIIRRLNYPGLFEGTYQDKFRKIHEVTWNTEHKITPSFRLKKILADIQDYKLTGAYHVVYFDAFAPNKQPELWTQEIFMKIFGAMTADSILTTYSSKSEVKKRLIKCGFLVEKIPGPPGKREMLRCLKKS